MTGFYRSGWRPAAGWACVAGLIVGLVVLPLLNVVLSAFGLAPVPPAGQGELLAATLGAAGLAGIRSIDKIRGVG